MEKRHHEQLENKLDQLTITGVVTFPYRQLQTWYGQKITNRVLADLYERCSERVESFECNPEEIYYRAEDGLVTIINGDMFGYFKEKLKE